MNERLTDAERRAMLAGDRTGTLHEHDDGDDDLGLVADLLAEPSTWSEPDPSLEDRVVRAVAEAEPAPPSRRPAPVSARRGPRSRGRRVLYAATAAAASVAVVVGAAVATGGGGPGTDFSARLDRHGARAGRPGRGGRHAQRGRVPDRARRPWTPPTPRRRLLPGVAQEPARSVSSRSAPSARATARSCCGRVCHRRSTGPSR